MDPRRALPYQKAQGLPRPRGDGPSSAARRAGGGVASPATRGWTPCRDRVPSSRRGFPAHAGMDHPAGSARRTDRWLPRPREDELLSGSLGVVSASGPIPPDRNPCSSACGQAPACWRRSSDNQPSGSKSERHWLATPRRRGAAAVASGSVAVEFAPLVSWRRACFATFSKGHSTVSDLRCTSHAT